MTQGFGGAELWQRQTRLVLFLARYTVCHRQQQQVCRFGGRWVLFLRRYSLTTHDTVVAAATHSSRLGHCCPRSCSSHCFRHHQPLVWMLMERKLILLLLRRRWQG
jgi:hypothetical protein